MANRRLTLVGIIGGVAVLGGGLLTLALTHRSAHPVTVPVAHSPSSTAKDHGAQLKSQASSTAAPLMMPVNGSISNPFGWQYSGALNEWYYNPGITISAKAGTPVHAAWGGVVTQVENVNHQGLSVTIKDGDQYETVYGHLGSASVKAGEMVKQGQVIGTVGGSSIYSHQPGSHLDFDVYHGSMATNPEGYLHPSS
ncbi:M23 family metallopeptidase [Sulfobacillus thermosulfidooxidans]|uniref:M23 family peptidase n=1 Tax=Sulfobacillus thermosulfidooxidans TaxID=28034 RepID=A0A1R0IUY8_SULTH|nr:M23 family metallopeptidase [Sulfobacillus thermosulfidooxidans]OLZ10657.1 peptidase M23 [Sulfobacillus thermosulfidooxidans]OLZ17548.1 peptidase M23 [Sulfobacillus thermosulfidooxidans]OLZ20888.1 peptidase M23 [Sulfobacillus thermosulfidooxidans]PSR24581.1 MAG: M23 family peptidase [Sulfobacillus thermosulfidooxidans]